MTFIRFIAGLLALLTLGAAALPALAATPVAPSTCIDLKHDLSQGARDSLESHDVTALQGYLVSAGYLTVAPTGYFGPLTLRAVQKFQMQAGLPAQGFVGPLTRTQLTTRSCPNSFTFMGINASSTVAVGTPAMWLLAFTVPAAATSSISYSVLWGDEASGSLPKVQSVVPTARTAYAIFTHTYGTTGDFSPTFVASYGSDEPIRVVAQIQVK